MMYIIFHNPPVDKTCKILMLYFVIVYCNSFSMHTGQCELEAAWLSFFSIYSVLTALLISIHIKNTITDVTYRFTDKKMAFNIAVIFFISLIDSLIPFSTHQYGSRGFDCYIIINRRPSIGINMRMGTRFFQIFLVVIIISYNYVNAYKYGLSVVKDQSEASNKVLRVIRKFQYYPGENIP